MNCSRETNQSILHQGRSQADSIGYMPGLDGLRALAVFAVIAYHLNLSWAQGGLLGVSLFFVLSGYLITNILLTQWDRSGSIDLKDFWLRRARRLLPALFVMLAGVLAWVAFFVPERLAVLKPEALAAVFYTGNWYLIFHDVSYFERFGPPSPLGHLWSLAVEEQFYLLWPLLLGLGLRFTARRKWVIGGTVAAALASAVAMALIYIPGHDPSRVYYGTDTRAFALLVGAVLAMIWPGGRMSADLSCRKRLALDAAGSMGLLIVLFMIVRTNQYQTSLYQGGLLFFSAAAACLVAALVHPASRLGRLFGWRPLRWLGECSYGIYLWHYPVIALTSPAISTGGSDFSRALWQITISIILAALSRYLIEEPIRYGRRKRSQAQMRDLPRWRSVLAFGIKISVNFMLILLILFVSAEKGVQISAEDLSENIATEQQAQVIKVQAPVAQTQTPEQEAPEQQSEAPRDLKGDGITAIGDSVLTDVKPVLQERLPGIVIESKIGRQMHEAADVIANLQRQGKLGKIVILELGTNGAFTEKQLTKTLDSLEGAETIVLVNTRVPRPWEAVVNEALTKAAESYPNTVLIDWYSASSGHDEYFYSDGVHLNRTGAEAYGELLIETLNNSVSPESVDLNSDRDAEQ